jgi:hypothetical protein
MTAPDVDGPQALHGAALRSARINADQVQYLNAHGTSTRLGDVNETNAIKLAFGDAARSLVVNSTKSMTGHLLGGAGGVESVFTALALHHQVSPPTINLDTPDPECDLDYCANTARPDADRIRDEKLLRLWRHQRDACLQACLIPVGTQILLSAFATPCPAALPSMVGPPSGMSPAGATDAIGRCWVACWRRRPARVRAPPLAGVRP